MPLNLNHTIMKKLILFSTVITLLYSCTKEPDYAPCNKPEAAAQTLRTNAQEVDLFVDNVLYNYRYAAARTSQWGNEPLLDDLSRSANAQFCTDHNLPVRSDLTPDIFLRDYINSGQFQGTPAEFAILNSISDAVYNSSTIGELKARLNQVRGELNTIPNSTANEHLKIVSEALSKLATELMSISNQGGPIGPVGPASSALPGWVRCALASAGGALVGGLGGAAAGSVVPVIGTVAGGVIGIIGGGIGGAQSAGCL
jgi:hypothetical protein